MLGLVSISFRKYSPEEILKEMQKAGLCCIEWGSDVHAPCTDLEKVKAVAKLQVEMGISCCSYGSYFRLGENNTNELHTYIQAAKILGTNVIRLWCGPKVRTIIRRKNWKICTLNVKKPRKLQKKTM